MNSNIENFFLKKDLFACLTEAFVKGKHDKIMLNIDGKDFTMIKKKHILKSRNTNQG